jgi:O-acetyl-ADP-ribose deacetylase (regulator of RNase III)
MPIEFVHGDLFAETSALSQGVNVDGVMGAGVAARFRSKWPAMYLAYRAECRAGALVPGGMFAWQAPDGRWVYNLASQDRPGRFARLEWVGSATALMLAHAREHDIARVAMPRIGAGIGGLDWEDVAGVLSSAVDAFPDVTVRVVSLPGTS